MTKANMPVNGTDGALQIRPLRAADEMQWRDLWTAYLHFYNTTLTADIYDSTFARLLGDDPQDFNALVAEKNGKLVGLTHYLTHRHAWKIENVCYLQDLYADPSVRGMGIGRALIEGVYAAADAADAPTVYWLTQENNTTARQLYDRVAAKTDFIKYQRVAASSALQPLPCHSWRPVPRCLWSTAALQAAPPAYR